MLVSDDDLSKNLHVLLRLDIAKFKGNEHFFEEMVTSVTISV
jgi:hypothetical protein